MLLSIIRQEFFCKIARRIRKLFFPVVNSRKLPNVRHVLAWLNCFVSLPQSLYAILTHHHPLVDRIGLRMAVLIRIGLRRSEK